MHSVLGTQEDLETSTEAGYIALGMRIEVCSSVSLGKDVNRLQAWKKLD